MSNQLDILAGTMPTTANEVQSPRPRAGALRPLVALTGGRDNAPTPDELAWLVAQVEALNPSGVIHGDARGFDTIVARHLERAGWQTWGLPYRSEHGKAGGAIRNRDMAERLAARPGSVLLAGAGGNGTDDMVKQARRLKVRVVESPGRLAEAGHAHWMQGD